MGRRSDHSRDELKAMAIAAATEIVREQGLRSLTARGVAGRIGYSVGTLYNVFRDLDDLVVHLNGETLERLRAALPQGPESGESPRGVVEALALAYIAFAFQERELWSALFEHRLPPGRDLPDWLQGHIQSLLAAVERSLAALFPGRSAVEHRRQARLLWSAVHGVAVLAASGKLEVVEGESVEDMTRALVAVLLAGWGNRE